MPKNLFKAINKYLKLRTIRILREQYLHTFTCLAATYDIWFAKASWYRHQVLLYAIQNEICEYIPMTILAVRNGTAEADERLKFLNYLEDLVLKDKA